MNMNYGIFMYMNLSQTFCMMILIRKNYYHHRGSNLSLVFLCSCNQVFNYHDLVRICFFVFLDVLYQPLEVNNDYFL